MCANILNHEESKSREKVPFCTHFPWKQDVIQVFERPVLQGNSHKKYILIDTVHTIFWHHEEEVRRETHIKTLFAASLRQNV